MNVFLRNDRRNVFSRLILSACVSSGLVVGANFGSAVSLPNGCLAAGQDQEPAQEPAQAVQESASAQTQPPLPGPGASPPAVSVLIRQLSSADVGEQIDAAVQLGSRGPYAQAAVRPLSQLLNSKDAALQYECVVALGNIGPLAHQAADNVAVFLASPVEDLQSAALESLRRIGNASPQAEQQIQQLAQSENLSLATSAVRCLLMISGPENEVVRGAVPRLISALADQRLEVGNEAAITLVDMGSEIVPEVAVALTSTIPHVRMKACEIMEAIGPAAESAVPDLLERLRDDQELVVRAATRALGRTRAQPESVVPALQMLLQHPSLAIRITAVRAIGEFGPDAVAVVPSLLNLLAEESPVLRASAADALGQIGDTRDEVINALMNSLADMSAVVTINAANGLSQMGAPAVPSLLPLLQDPDYRQLAVEVFGDMGVGAEAAVPALVDLLGQLEDQDEALRREIFITLASIGPRAAAATPAMMSILSNPKAGNTRAGAAYVLARIGEPRALPILKAILGDSENEQLLRSAAWATVALEPGNKSNAGLVMPYLLKAASSEMPLVRREVMTAFATLGPEAGAALPVLLEHAAGDPDSSVRAMSLNALSEIHAPSTQVLPIAIVALGDPDVMVRNAARHVLGRLGSDATEASPRLRESVRRGDEVERILAAWALVQVDPSEENRDAAMPLMLKAMRYPNPGIRSEAARTLGVIGKQSPEARTALESAKNDPHPMVQQAVEQALAALQANR